MREKRREDRERGVKRRGESTDKHAERQADTRLWGINTKADREFDF